MIYCYYCHRLADTDADSNPKDALTLLSSKASHPELEAGPKLVAMISVGTKVVRGRDWKWDEQDGSPPGQGKVIDPPEEDGWVRVRWERTCICNSYR